MARKTSDSDEPMVGPQSKQDEDESTNPHGTGESPTSGLTFTAEGGTPAQHVEFSDSQMVKDGEWNPATHGEPPDARPKRNY